MAGVAWRGRVKRGRAGDQASGDRASARAEQTVKKRANGTRQAAVFNLKCFIKHVAPPQALSAPTVLFYCSTSSQVSRLTFQPSPPLPLLREASFLAIHIH